MPESRRRIVGDDAARFASKITRSGDCWIWHKASGNGYGYFYSAGRWYLAHRYSYEQHVGPIPEGLVLDHLCHRPLCVNPAHLEAITQGDNVRRGRSPEVMTAWHAANRKTHCPHGHEYTPENTYHHPRGHRSCRTCDRARWTAYNRRRNQ